MLRRPSALVLLATSAHACCPTAAASRLRCRSELAARARWIAPSSLHGHVGRSRCRIDTERRGCSPDALARSYTVQIVLHALQISQRGLYLGPDGSNRRPILILIVDLCDLPPSRLASRGYPLALSAREMCVSWSESAESVCRVCGFHREAPKKAPPTETSRSSPSTPKGGGVHSLSCGKCGVGSCRDLLYHASHASELKVRLKEGVNRRIYIMAPRRRAGYG